MRKFFTRVYNTYTGEITQLNFFANEEAAKEAFNASAKANARNYGQPFWRMWTNKEGVTWCDYGSYCEFLQWGKINGIN